ncbi:hypothetical protein [Synechococcus elongatus]|uniref:hypothetical protein n=1 Tax=Synechococcus elongatus TaxID=32046 RepID=UPI000F7DF236|nr:hypothetical protein [Synechococcus elongatus]
MYFDRFDICEAYWMFASSWHGGQGCELYRILSRLSQMGFKPSIGLRQPKDLSDNGRAIYKRLVVGHCGRHSTNPYAPAH